MNQKQQAQTYSLESSSTSTNTLPLPFDVVVKTLQGVCSFLLECGGNYQVITGEIQEKILVCLAARQFIIKIRDGKIKYFACWFKVQDKDVEAVKERILPVDVFTGYNIYVSEFANSEGRKGMVEMIQRMRKLNPTAKEVFWHRPVKEDKVYHFKVRSNNGR